MGNFAVIALKLCLISLVIALMLSLTNMLTKDKIAENQLKAEEAAVEKVVPIPGREILSVEQDENKQGVRVITTNSGDKYYAVTAAGKGYGGDVVLMVGLDGDYKVVGLTILEMSETPGLGSNAENESFLTQFVGKGSDLVIKKGVTNPATEVEAISGATITSNAVREGVANAIQIAQGK